VLPLLFAILAAAASPAAAAASASPPLTPMVRPIDQAGYVKLLAASKGRPLVVNMWATWCDPCREEFPDLVRLHRELAGRGVQVAAISLDMASALDTGVVPFLKSAGASFPCFIKTAGGDDEFINAVDPKWSGALPATFVYDGEGRMVKSFFGTTTFDKLKTVVAPLLSPAP
jgi:thiol-disulfide isomerase/thioredoxin